MRLQKPVPAVRKPVLPNCKTLWLDWARAIALPAEIPSYCYFSVGEFKLRRNDVIARVRNTLNPATQVFLRSSKNGEDSIAASEHGCYESVGPVRLSDVESVVTAIEQVIRSYNDGCDDNLVIAQLWVDSVGSVVGAHTHGSRDIALYASVSYCRDARSSAITAGTVNVERYVVAKAEATSPDVEGWPRPVCAAIAVLAALESHTCTRLEIEAVFDEDERMHLLQVRPVPSKQLVEADTAALVKSLLNDAKSEVEIALDRYSTVYSGMSDWNPFELLGAHPRPLAADIFDVLIGRRSWWEAREALGYDPALRGTLVTRILGRPYVDLRASCLSLLPNRIATCDRVRYADFVVKRLKADAALHDRVEIDLYAGALRFDEHNTSVLRGAGLGSHATKIFEQRLNEHAQSILCAQFTELSSDAVRFAEEVCNRRIDTCDSFAQLSDVLECVRRELVLPFAKCARVTFFSHAVFHSARNVGLLSEDELADFQHCCAVLVESLAPNLEHASRRPLMFEVSSPALAASRDEGRSSRLTASRDHSFLASFGDKLSTRIVRTHVLADHSRLAKFLQLAQRSAVYRELWKDAMGRSLSRLFGQIQALSTRRKLTPENLSYLSLPTVLRLDASHEIATERLVSEAMRIYAAEHEILMPRILCSVSDLTSFCEGGDRPTFRGRGLVRGEIVHVKHSHKTVDAASAIRGKVVAIDSADPGFDWVFAFEPSAMVTCFGGPHSHMAIRSAQARVPCLLGCGISMFSQICGARSVLINFESQSLEVIV